MFKLPPLPGRGSHAFRASFRLAGFGRLAVQPFVGVPLRGFGQFDAPLLRARQYTVSPVALLQVCLITLSWVRRVGWLVVPTCGAVPLQDAALLLLQTLNPVVAARRPLVLQAAASSVCPCRV